MFNKKKKKKPIKAFYFKQQQNKTQHPNNHKAINQHVSHQQ